MIRRLTIPCHEENLLYALKALKRFGRFFLKPPLFSHGRLEVLIDSATLDSDGEISCFELNVKREVEKAMSMHRCTTWPPEEGEEAAREALLPPPPKLPEDLARSFVKAKKTTS